MSVLPASQEINMLVALDNIAVTDWRVTSAQVVEAQATKAHLASCIASFVICPTDDSLREINSAWMRAKRALKISTPAIA